MAYMEDTVGCELEHGTAIQPQSNNDPLQAPFDLMVDRTGRGSNKGCRQIGNEPLEMMRLLVQAPVRATS